jgi:hypothetical protein
VATLAPIAAPVAGVGASGLVVDAVAAAVTHDGATAARSGAIGGVADGVAAGGGGACECVVAGVGRLQTQNLFELICCDLWRFFLSSITKATGGREEKGSKTAQRHMSWHMRDEHELQL